jgi:hypothetical protein
VTTHQKAVAQLIAKIRTELKTIEGLAAEGKLDFYTDQESARLRVMVKHMTRRVETAGPNDTN